MLHCWQLTLQHNYVSAVFIISDVFLVKSMLLLEINFVQASTHQNHNSYTIFRKWPRIQVKNLELSLLATVREGAETYFMALLKLYAFGCCFTPA